MLFCFLFFDNSLCFLICIGVSESPGSACVCVCVCVCVRLYSKVISEAYDFRGKASYGEKQKEKKETSGQRIGPPKSQSEVVLGRGM